MMSKAVAAYTKEQQKPMGDKRAGLRKIALEFGVDYSTLRNRYNGMQSMSEFNAGKQKLSPSQEKMLVDLILVSSDWGVPLTNTDIISYANTILKRIFGEDAEEVGKAWVERFLDRHYDKLQTYWSKPLDTLRANSLNPDAVKGWFKILQEEVVDKNIPEENIFAMDESGFPPSDQGTQRVVG